MDIETVRAKMLAQVEPARRAGLAQAFGWGFEVDGLTAYVSLAPRRRPEKVYLLQVAFDEFPLRPPSCVFVDRVTKEMTDGAWPPGVRHGGPPPGICTPGTREFHEHLHRGDRQYEWNPERYPFLSTLAEIHRMMELGIGG